VVAYARANPGLVSVGSSGIASDDHLAILQMEYAAKIKLRHVPFPGGGALNRALNDRRIVVAGQNLGEALSKRAKGQTRILALMSPERWSVAPDIPTATELGFPIVMGSMRGIAAPVGLPSGIRQKLVGALLLAVKDPEFVSKASNPLTYQALRILGPAEFSLELARQDQKFRKLWQHGAWGYFKASDSDYTNQPMN
jgi:tripartite-type tricarboxylate transporter receptor subunit TctC